MLTKIFASLMLTLLGLAVGVGTGILVGIKGWGLTPQHWGWIIGASVCGQMLGIGIIRAGAKLLKEEE